MAEQKTISTANGIDMDELQEPKITVGHTDKATIVTFTNKRMLEEWDFQTLQELIIAVIEQTQRIKLILDFRNVQFISSSAGLGALIRISKQVYEREGQLRLCNINPKVHEIFEITWLTKILDIQPDLESAIESLSTAD
ncbi:MAG: STAS domain-containing protein [Planctomycetota bacterium]|jgi:anti-sigma B factor antagonist